MGWGVLAALPAAAQGVDPGQQAFVSRCARCHGTDGNGGEIGPSITARIPLRTDEDLERCSGTGCRPPACRPSEPRSKRGPGARALSANAEAAERPGPASGPGEARRRAARSRAGQNQSLTDLQLLGDDRRIHLLRTRGDRYRTVTSQTDWPSYNGTTQRQPPQPARADRHDKRRARWRQVDLQPAEHPRLQGTPVVVGGVMYVTSGNECYALDAGTGRQIWRYQRARTKGMIGNAGGGINRGAAVAGDRVFMVTDHAHLIALDRATGALLWDTEMADWRQNYGATGRAARGRRPGGVGRVGRRRRRARFHCRDDQSTGKEVWRFWTVPRRGEPGSETWKGNAIDHPGGATWLTGTYDPELDTLYWPVGNPGPDFIGDDRGGDNLYTSSIVALDAEPAR